MNSIKIGTLNQAVGQAVTEKQPAGATQSDIPAQDMVDRAHPVTNIDNVNLSIPNLQSEKNISILISNLLEALDSSGLLSSRATVTPSEDANMGLLIKVLDSLFYKGEEPLSFLKKFIEKSGLLYEAKIAEGDIKALDDDLKGVLLRLIEITGKKTEGGKAAEALLKDIEARQLLNAAAKDDRALYLQIPVMFPQGPSTAEIYVRRDGQEKGGYKGDSYRVGFSMELTEAGLLSVVALVSGNNVSIRLKAEKAEFLEFMKSHLPELTERLAGYGFKMAVSG